ncbi:MAG TPA: serine O-acetyltransferase EpsC [Myxococcales bacterium]|nr:serine O-acetyltransferase EpsC [Myxococcales bacterium]
MSAVEELARAAEPLPRGELPSRIEVLAAIEAIRSAFFPGYFERAPASTRAFVREKIEQASQALTEEVRRALSFGGDGGQVNGRAAEVVRQFVTRLPAVRRLAASDVEAAFAGDPALRNRHEAILCYPGLLAVTSQRLAHELYALEVPLLPRMITEAAHSKSGIDIHPGAWIGEAFFIDHGTGVVIGETARIGNRVRLYQGVTLGAKSFPLDSFGRPVKGAERHPIVEDDVVIYAEATILGRVTIGRGSIIGGNVWLTHSVPPGSRVTQAAAEAEAFAGGAGI